MTTAKIKDSSPVRPPIALLVICAEWWHPPTHAHELRVPSLITSAGEALFLRSNFS
jgi:hypothetical protein